MIALKIMSVFFGAFFERSLSLCEIYERKVWV
ncbi:hypothetical protein HPPN120_00920 [Helicobacter pylori Puno120]|nr:hypothetical protein HPPN120_00920 [Helicobacter pylori Puno120]